MPGRQSGQVLSGPDPALANAHPLTSEQRRQLLAELIETPAGAWVTCAGRSMEPTIRRGDRVCITATDRVRIGDVVLFAGARGLVLHRVIAVVPGTGWFGTGWFLHVGDAGSEDGPGLARTDRVLGRADVPRRLPTLRECAAGARRLALAAVNLSRKRRMTP